MRLLHHTVRTVYISSQFVIGRSDHASLKYSSQGRVGERHHFPLRLHVSGQAALDCISVPSPEFACQGSLYIHINRGYLRLASPIQADHTAGVDREACLCSKCTALMLRAHSSPRGVSCLLEIIMLTLCTTLRASTAVKPCGTTSTAAQGPVEP